MKVFGVADQTDAVIACCPKPGLAFSVTKTQIQENRFLQVSFVFYTFSSALDSFFTKKKKWNCLGKKIKLSPLKSTETMFESLEKLGHVVIVEQPRGQFL